MTAPKFQRRHYREIANTLALTRPEQRAVKAAGSATYWVEPPEYTKWHHIVDRLIFMFQLDNANFDREKFLTWCYAKVGGAHV